MSTIDPMKPVYFVDGARTPFLKAPGGPGHFSASDLAVLAGRALLSRQRFSPEAIDEVILGAAMPSPDEPNIGRIVALRLGCGHKTPGYTVMRNCASAMQALDSAAKDIQLGRANLVLAGGTEAMSRAPVLFNRHCVTWLAKMARAKSLGQKLKTFAQFRPHFLKPDIGLIKGLTDPIVNLNMGQTCEVIAHQFGITREQMDEYAVQSHDRLAAATDEGRLNEIVPIYDDRGEVYDFDDGLRRGSSAEKLAKLRSVFDRRVGMVTAGNSSQITDGAAVLLMASEEAVKQYNLPVLGELVDTQWGALDPAKMGLGPVHASTPILQRHNLKPNDIDVWEINEAFAGQVLACTAAWQDDNYCKTQLGLDGAMGPLDSARLNIDGGAISLGHPVGATGARIVLHALQALHQRDQTTAMATLCIGGGQGGAMLLKRNEG